MRIVFWSVLALATTAGAQERVRFAAGASSSRIDVSMADVGERLDDGAIVLRDREARFIRDECVIVFRFGDDRVYVEQESDGAYCDFGTSVSAAGVYQRSPVR